MVKKTFDHVLISALVIYAIFLGLLGSISYWPKQLWWLGNLLSMAPLWPLAIPLLILFLIAPLLRNRVAVLISLVSGLLLLFGIMGFKISLPLLPTPATQQLLSLKVITVNMGGGVSLEAFTKLVSDEKPDIIAFQELSFQTNTLLEKTFKAGDWNWISHEELGLASRYKITSMELRDRRPADGQGHTVAKYELATPAGPIYVLNVHLQTPRRGIHRFIKDHSSLARAMQGITSGPGIRIAYGFQPSQLISSVLIAGDFNLPENSPIFRAFWSRYQDAFSKKGTGFGFTRHEGRYSVRIDHLLSDTNWQIQEARVGPDINGDHHPLITRLTLSRKFITPDEKSPKTAPRDQNALIFESFDFSPGKFRGNETTLLSVTSEQTTGSGLALKMAARNPLESIQAGIALDGWRLEAFPTVHFSYMIPSQMTILLRVKTEWDDWLCLGGTTINACPSANTSKAPLLIADGAWHEIQLDIKSVVQSALPGVKWLKEFQFFNLGNEQQETRFWIDDFRIEK